MITEKQERGNLLRTLLLSLAALGLCMLWFRLRGGISLGLSVAFNLCLAVAAALLSRSWRPWDCRGLSPWGQLLWGVGLALAFLLALGAMNLALTGQFSLLGLLRLPPGELAALLLMQLAVALGEELFFRAWVLEALRRLGLPDWAACLLAGFVLFGGLHLLLRGGWVNLLIPGAIGLALSLALCRGGTCSLWSLVLAHFLYDICIMAS